MAVSAGVAIGTGVAAGVGATAAAVRAAKLRAQARQQSLSGDNYGYYANKAWNDAEYNDQQTKAAQGVLAGQVDAANAQRVNGQALLYNAQRDQAPVSQVGTAAQSYLSMLNPGAVSGAMSRQVLDQNAQANLGAARASGALGLRNALNANAQAGVQSAGQLATMRAQEEQQLRVAQANQASEDDARRIQAEEAQRQRVLQQMQLGANYSSAGLNAANQAASTFGQQTLSRELGQSQIATDRDEAQLQADVNYDTRRQGEQQRRSDRLWGFAGGLLGVAGSSLGGLGKK